MTGVYVQRITGLKWCSVRQGVKSIFFLPYSPNPCEISLDDNECSCATSPYFPVMSHRMPDQGPLTRIPRTLQLWLNENVSQAGKSGSKMPIRRMWGEGSIYINMLWISVLTPSLEHIYNTSLSRNIFGILAIRHTWYPCNEQSEGNGALLRGNPNHPSQPGSKVFQVSPIKKYFCTFSSTTTTTC